MDDEIILKYSNFTSLDNLNNLSYIQYAEGDDAADKTDKALAEQLNDEFKTSVLPVTVFVGLEVVLGFFGNILVLYVFAFHYHVCNFRYFVLCLAIIDVTSSLTTMPGEMVTQLFWYVYPLRELCKVKSFFNVFTVSAEALCLLTIALDRYRKICQPLRWQIRPRIAIYLCASIYTVAVVLALPVAFFWGTHSHPKVYKNIDINVTICEKDEQWKNTKYPLIYSLTVEVIVSISLVLMLGMYVLVARKLLQEKRERKKAYSTTPMVVITPAPALDTGVPSNANTLNTSTEVSDTGYSSGLDSKGQPRQINKDIEILSDCETDHQEFSSTLQVPTRGNPASIDRPNNTHNSPRKQHARMNISARVRRKTLIMFILTIAFIATTILYLTLLSFIARSDDILQDMSDSGKATYFFFFRLYFLNHVINPIVYGLLDPRFKKVMGNIRNSMRIK
ncbi:cephalotocin receptor 1-like [Mercenaria mercenaria]|uniref:cephalotocin receptor 1-like n=1 Tax=Mercenaria mercenaria TaxID=6596 RepID=UPI00234FA7F9|nr:cephalotocin receptor 1-like [Mercenaria mercenaria]